MHAYQEAFFTPSAQEAKSAESELFGYLNALITCSPDFHASAKGYGYVLDKRVYFEKVDICDGLRLVRIAFPSGGAMDETEIRFAFIRHPDGVRLSFAALNGQGQPIAFNLWDRFVRICVARLSAQRGFYRALISDRIVVEGLTLLGAIPKRLTPTAFEAAGRFDAALLGGFAEFSERIRKTAAERYDLRRFVQPADIVKAGAADRGINPGLRYSYTGDSLMITADAKASTMLSDAVARRLVLTKSIAAKPGARTITIPAGSLKTVGKALRKSMGKNRTALRDLRGISVVGQNNAATGNITFGIARKTPASRTLMKRLAKPVKLNGKVCALELPETEEAKRTCELSERYALPRSEHGPFSYVLPADRFYPFEGKLEAEDFYLEVDRRLEMKELAALPSESEQLRTENTGLRTDIADLQHRIAELEERLRRQQNALSAKDAQLGTLTAAIEKRTGAEADSSTLSSVAGWIAEENDAMTPLEALRAAQALCPAALTVLPSALKSAEDVPTEFAQGARLLKLLLRLCRRWMPLFIEGGEHAAAGVFTPAEYCAGETKLLRASAAGQTRRFLWRGEPVEMFRHLRLGVASNKAFTLRVYFECFPAEGRIVIGWCGEHLPVVGRS